MLDKAVSFIKQLTEAGVALIALAIVVQIIFGTGVDSSIPFIGGLVQLQTSLEHLVLLA